MDRKQFLIDTQRHYAEAQQALLAEIDALEANHGIPADQLCAIYGANILDVHSADSLTVKRWIELCEMLHGTDKAMVAIGTSRSELVPGCYGFGQKTQYDTIFEAIVITDPRSAEISFETDDSTTRAFIKCQGYRLPVNARNTPHLRVPSRTENETFDDLLEAPQVITQEIASYGSDMLDMIVEGDTFSALHGSFRKSAARNYLDHFVDDDAGYSDALHTTLTMHKLAYADGKRRRKQLRTAEETSASC